MPEEVVRFSDGAAYEDLMGKWSQIAGSIFLDWVAAPAGLRWIDVGCGNGAFTESLVGRCAPAGLIGVDPSEGQLAFARSRPAARIAEFRQGNAMALPMPDDSVDAAVMALVIFFVPEPAKGVAEMARVVRPGGIVAAYAWDIIGGGFPLEPIWDEMRGLGLPPSHPPRADASRLDAMRALWVGAGLADIETREITVERRFADFEEFWRVSYTDGMARQIADVDPDIAARLKTRVRDRLKVASDGPLTLSARANAAKGRIPA